MRHVPTIDASGIHILEELVREADRDKYLIVFSAVSRNVYRSMRKSGLVETVGRKNFAADIFAALDIAKAYLETLQKKEQE
jgi:SulP family sulfate permease